MAETTRATILKELPVFPLTGSLLLPGTFLPLNIFERRYRNLVEDALAGDRLLGMVQPRQPAADNWGPDPESPEHPELYRVGCVGRIASWRRETDGRFLIVLEGRTRFRTIDEHPLHRGYRRIAAKLLDSDRRSHHGDDIGGTKVETVLSTAIQFCRRLDIELDADLLAALPAWRLVNALSTALPFAPEEKQLLVEADTVAERGELLLRLMALARSEWTPLPPVEAEWVH